MELSEKRVFVLGGTGGIGSAITQNLLHNGAKVVVCSKQIRPTFRLNTVSEKNFFVAADAANPDSLMDAVLQSVSWLGGLDVMVHSVGGSCHGRITDLKPEDWTNTLNVHLNSAFHLSRQVLPFLRRNREGAIIFISSAAAYRAPADAIGYSTVKAALIQLARCLAQDLAVDNIRVNCISPGFVNTPFHGEVQEDFFKDLCSNRIPLGRLGRVDEVAQLVNSVLRNDYLTGQSIVLDGGLNMSYR